MQLTFACNIGFQLSHQPPQHLSHSLLGRGRLPHALRCAPRSLSASNPRLFRDALSNHALVACASLAKEAHGDDELLRTDFEDALTEMESRVLREMGTTEVTLGVFADWLLAGELNLFPAYQRDYVWKPDKASRLIATVLCNRHVPPVVLHEKEEGVFDVVDGKQRLTCILGFLLNGNAFQARLKEEALQPKLEKVLPQLKELVQLDESYQGISGLTFDLLSPKRKRSYKKFTVAYVKIPMSTPITDVFEVYDDINSGGENLRAQQVRRAVYYGPYIQLLDSIADSHGDFHAIRDPAKVKENKYVPCMIHSDRELILRAFAFRENGGRFKTPLKTFLNRELEGSNNFENRPENERKALRGKMEELQQEFTIVMKVARSVFGDRAFRRGDQGNKEKINVYIWDAMYSALAELLTEGYKHVNFTEASGSILQAWEDMIESKTLDGSQLRSKADFLERKETIKALFREAIKHASPARDPQRAFSPEMKDGLYRKQSGLCAICGQNIDFERLGDGRYAQIDHITPHSRGGRTSRDNAQLAHAECNREKSVPRR